MILFDFSALMHQSIFSGVTNMKPELDASNHYKTKDFITFTKYYILENLFNIQNNFYSYGDIVLCMDDHSKPNWRRRIYANYKKSRKSNRDQSQIHYDEVFEEINQLTDVLDKNTPWKVVQTPQAEGDDVVLVLAKQFAPKEKILIVSSDKDMLQAQKYGDVKQYSLFTHQFVNADTKHENNINDWILDHVVLGDVADEIPKITDNTIFSDEFNQFLNANNYSITEEKFYNLNTDEQLLIDNQFKQSQFAKPYNIKSKKTKNNPSGEKLFQPEVFTSPRFGKATLRKKIEQFGSLEKWIESNTLYKQNYERNKKLVLADYIPTDIYQDILYSYKNASNTFNEKQFNDYIENNKISNIKSMYSPNFTSELKVEDFFN